VPVLSEDEERRPVRVVLSNDYEIALLGLAQMLARHPDQVQLVGLTTEARMPHPADVILFDTFGRLPADDRKLRTVVRENSPAKVVVYSWEDYPEEAARRNGAVGYLHKGLPAAELVAALVAAHRGGTPPPVPDDELVPSWPGQVYGLSQREAEMLTFITRGLSNEEIAEQAYLSINSVKSYIRNAYKKIGVRTRPQAVAWGYRHGFQSTDEIGL
jgi:DNA-binding NarL/FixJ family response regulator